MQAAKGILYIADRDEAAQTQLRSLAGELQMSAAFPDSGDALLAEIHADTEGCVVCDFRLRDMNGLELLQSLRQRSICLPVVFYTAGAQTAFTVEAIRLGAATVLEKPAPDLVLWDSLLKALRTGAERRERAAAVARIEDRFAQLSRREHDILSRIVNGQSNKEIASELEVSLRTIEASRQRILKRMGANSVAELVRLWVELQYARTSNGR